MYIYIYIYIYYIRVYTYNTYICAPESQFVFCCTVEAVVASAIQRLQP